MEGEIKRRSTKLFFVFKQIKQYLTDNKYHFVTSLISLCCKLAFLVTACFI
jgi:hypothetical protein